MEASNLDNITTQQQGRRFLLMMTAFFALPVLLVLLMHHFNWHPQGQSVGLLVTPPVLLQVPSDILDNVALEKQQTTLTVDTFKDKWSLVFVSPDCHATCAERLYSMRQLHVALAKESNRVQRVWITQQANTESIQAQYPDMHVLKLNPSQWSAMTAQFEKSSEGRLQSEVYLVDPLANIMMRYPQQIQASEMYKEIMHLLKYAWAG